MDDNPTGVELRQAGSATAFLAAGLPVFNAIAGLRAGEHPHVAPLAAWYREHGIAPRFELAAGEADAPMVAALLAAGLVPAGQHAALIADPEPDRRADETLECVADAAGMEAFPEAYVRARARAIPGPMRDEFKSNVRPWLHERGWRLYLARADGQPAAYGILFLADGIAYLADAATDPEFRGRGLHAALLGRRLRDAARAGAAFITAGAEFLSTSHRNMDRAGLRLLFLRTIWSPP